MMNGDVFGDSYGIYLMLAVLLYILLLYCVDELERLKSKRNSLSDEEILVRLSKKRACSEFDIFGMSTGDWNISKSRIQDDFNNYLIYGHMPFYVRDYVRKRKKKVENNDFRQFPLGGRLPPSWSA